MAHVAFPYSVDGRGRTAEAETDDAHVRHLIEQVLFTVPGERVNRPDFGCGLLQLVFAPNSDELAATLQVLVQGALQQWLGSLLRIDQVTASHEDSTLRVQVSYTVLRTQASRTASFTQEVPS
ncbi:GPW/gp25 family protein [Variovorax sp. J22R133]|uniref:GPW/gp25 family protein n=1 Tax=Variovorax brevis TaxID=3053503 RepID=UPI002577D1FD|nr:GPW/gp25 family protein [Variovorax sp. J22R133]MDM0112231.1 GPW/gp25 family protein [Variovorax sp. J22R133]